MDVEQTQTNSNDAAETANVEDSEPLAEKPEVDTAQDQGSTTTEAASVSNETVPEIKNDALRGEPVTTEASKTPQITASPNEPNVSVPQVTEASAGNVAIEVVGGKDEVGTSQINSDAQPSSEARGRGSTHEEPAETAVEHVPESALPVMPPLDPMEIAKSLDHDVLLAASRLIAMERLEGMTEARIAKQKAGRASLDKKIVESIAKRKNGAKLSIVAFECNLTLRTMADNLRRLRREGRIYATGTGRSRLYFLN